MNKPRASRNSKKYPLPRSIFVPEANGSISGEAKSQSSIISLKISNERDPENVVIEWYRNYRNNKPFDNKLQPRLNMSKRQSAGGGCRSVEIKRSYPCVKCKQLNKKCECAKFRNVYRNMYGPTTDETILVGMETLHNLVSSRCSESRSSVKAVNGTVYQPREYPAENGPPHNHKRDNNGGRGRDREMDNKPNKYRDYPSGSDEANIELLELDKNQSESRKRDDDKARRDNRKTKGNDNGRNGYKKGRGYEDNTENARREVVSFNKAVCGDDDTPSVYSDIKTDNADALSKYSLSDSSSRAKIQTDNGTDYDEEIAQNEINEQIAQRQEQDNLIKRTLTNVERNAVHRCSNDLVKQEPSSSKHHRNQQKDLQEPEQIDEPDTTSTEEIRDDTAEDTDSTEYNKPSPQLYTCLVNPVKNVKTIPVITRFVVPVWDRDKPYPTVHFISSVKDLTSMNASADLQKSSSGPSKNHRDLVEYLLNPMRYLSNTNNKENDSLRRSKSDSSLSVSSVRSTTPLFSEATTNMIRQDNFCLTEDELNSIYSPDERSNRVYIYDTGQRYLPIAKPEPMFAEQNNIGKQLYYMFQEKNTKTTNENPNNGSMSHPVESFSGEISDDENHVMSFTTSSSNIITDDNNSHQFDDKARESSDDVKDSEGTEPNKMKNETDLPTENRQEVICDISKCPSNVSMKFTDNDGSVMEESILSMSTNTSTSCTETSNSEHNTQLLRELNAIVNDKTERQVLTPIQEETETSDTETENKSSLLQNTVMPTLSTEQIKVENDNSVATDFIQNDTIAMDNSLTKRENDEKGEENGEFDTTESIPGTVSQSEEIIMIKQPPNNFEFTSSVYSPAPTTCSCFTVCSKTNDDDDDGTGNGKKTLMNDKLINTKPVRIKRESKYQQTDPVKLRPIKSKGDTSSGLAPSTTTTVSTDSASVRRGKRRSIGTMGKSRKSSTKSQSVTFERKFSKGDAFVEEIISECLDSVTADEAKSKEIISADHDMGDRSKSEQKFASRNLQSRETRYAIARITKYDEFTTYEILKSTRAKPRIIPQTTEGVFTVRNRKKRKLKL
ncbi:hypothetical protein CBL_10379 [Carabus blaptoides fortunei]